MGTPIPIVKTASGMQIPILGLGTWQSKSEEITQVIKEAIDVGYRHFDCAHLYGNEQEIGESINAKIAEGVVKREDLFITSKLWNTFHKPDMVEPALRDTLKKLGLGYLDLYLIHWPMAFKEGGPIAPVDADGKAAFSDVDYVDTWKAMEEVSKKGLAKLIGVSNFNEKQIERILQCGTIVPATNQIECHPFLTQTNLSNYCKSRGITITAYSPLGSPTRPWAKPEEPQLLEDERLKAIAKKYHKTVSQVLLRYQVQREHIVIPKSSSKSRIKENFEIWDFELSCRDIQNINSFDCNRRVFLYRDAIGHKYYPFADDYTEPEKLL